MIPLLRIRKRLKHLHEGERAYGAYYYNAPARLYHGVDNPKGMLDGDGPILENNTQIMERHIKRLTYGRPVDIVVQDLLETSKFKRKSTHKSTPNTRMLAKLAKTSPFELHVGNR